MAYQQPSAPGLAPPSARPLPDVPTAVSTLCDTTRRLEESLRRWAALEISENDVSDVFVSVGNSFHEMLAAFAAYGIDMREVHGFLQDLRTLLEECLSEDPTPENFGYLMPRVRTIIASLLRGLRAKQSIYWQAVHSLGRGGSSVAGRPGSGAGSRSSSGSERYR
ncbi:AIP3-domain-containing [Pyrrhoderma noxium]|uniref:AIP3-domain-containing n=1 Tax=Pyrrhoderma noxium TaxID=2282107 RepID=A0A286UK60_9AGAM|nr:AIP3-domain-containing [Pyrrhoderma noxium]